MGLPIRALAALTTAAFVTVLTEALPAGVLPAMSADLRVGEPAMGQAVTIYAVGTALAAIPLSAATAGWRRKRLLLCGVAGFALANTVTAVSGDYVLTMAARFVAGIAAGVVWALLAGYAARLAPEVLRGKAIAVVMAGIPLALSLGVPAGTFLGDVLGWRVTFWVMTAIAVVLLGWIAALVPDFPGSRGGRPALRATARVPGVPAILFVTLVFVLAHTVLYTYVATFLAARGMGDLVEIVLLVFGVASMVSIVVVGVYVDRRLRALTVVSAALFAVAVAVLAGSTAFVFVAAAVWGLGWGGVPTLLQAAAAKAGGPAADTAQAMLVTLWNAAMAAGGVVGGLLLDHAGPGALPWSALVLMPPVLAVVLAARGHAFPSARADDQRDPEGDHRGSHQAVQRTP
jgi:predicted MFS family arabinose efflux permease